MTKVLIIFGIFLGLVYYPTSIQAQIVKIPETAKEGSLVFNHTKLGTGCTQTDSPYFIFNETFLFVNKTPDLELDTKLCTDRTISLPYICYKAGSELTYSVAINIEAVDEFDPVLSTSIIDGLVREEEPKETKVKDQTSQDIDFNNYVSDKDCGDDSFQFTLLGDTHGMFSVKVSNLVTNKVIDYEKDDKMYNFTMVAENDPTDASQSKKNVSGTISISITDIDDMNPIFRNKSYTLRVEEENATFVNHDLTVTPPELAYDQDFGINQTLKYSLVDNDENFISINSVTGNITLNRTLDREHNARYSFEIKAVQNDSDQRLALSTLDLIVEDINDNHAIFPNTTIAVTIQENLAIGSIVKIVQAFDKDEDTNAEFQYTISGDILSVDPKSGTISVANSTGLDREAHETLTFQISTIPTIPVISSDICLKCNVTLKVTLSDVNDNDPIFAQSYTFTVQQNVADEFVGQVTATDDDKGANALIAYWIEGTNNFKINQSSGEITLASPTTLPIKILVKACDSPIITSQRRCNFTEVNVRLKDNSTVTGHNINAEITENLPINSIVSDIPFHSKQFGFALEENKYFKLNGNLIQTKVTLDREEKQYHSLQLYVLDGLQVQESYIVNITVKDVNDNAPKFKDNYVFSLKGDMKTGSVIGKVEATDEDEGINANITYYMEGQNSNYFFITATSGNISLRTMPDLCYTQQFLTLVVKAADSGFPSLQSIADVKVYVGMGNETLRIQVGKEKDTIIGDHNNYEKSLTEILGVKTAITNTSTYGAGSVIYISATNSTDDSQIPLGVLSRLVESNMAAIQELFMRKQQFAPSPTNNSLSVEAVALIVVACVLFVGSIFLTAVTYYKFKRYQRLQRLVHSLSRKNSIYETQETSIAIEDEVSEYDRQDSTSIKKLIEDDKTSQDNVPNGHVTGVVNPGYVADEPLTPEVQNCSENAEPELDYDNTDPVDPTTSSDIRDNFSEPSPVDEARLIDVEPATDYVNQESIEDPAHNESTHDYENTTDQDASLLDTDQSQGPVIPVPPPLPDILPPLSKSSSSSELKDHTPKTSSDASKTPQYQDVLLELYAAVKKKRADGDEEEDVEEDVKNKVDPEDETEDVPMEQPKVKYENWTGGSVVEDQDESGHVNPDASLNPASSDNKEPEPEPDYAKRVRFNEGGVKEENNPSSLKDTSEGDSDDEQSHVGHDLRNSEEIKSPDDSLNGESGTFVFGQVEITEF